MLTGKADTFIYNYFKRFASPEPVLSLPVHSNCRVVIVIPCYHEPDLIGTLASLSECAMPDYAVEVIVVVNQSEIAPDRINSRNRQTIDDFSSWQRHYSGPENLRFHCIEAMNLPKKHAGVGLARKTGMDEALRRFVSIDRDGVIVCLDADCRVSQNYLLAIDAQFVKTVAGLGEMHFEHRYEEEADPGLKKGIIHYELFLRYYVEGLRQSAFPYAIHTIGSCMLVKASIYAKHGGMNKRKAGEDFYFLHKIVPHEEFVTVNQGTVFPSCRTSDRVPFGTGKAQQDWLDQHSEQYLTHDPIVFSELKTFITSALSFYQQPVTEAVARLPESSRAFINQHGFDDKIALIKDNCKTEAQFLKQLFIWFDGFLCMKFVHFLRDEYYPNIPIEEAAARLIQSEADTAETLLEEYKAIDRKPLL